MNKTDERYLTVKVSVLLDDGSYSSCIRKIDRDMLTDRAYAERIILHESERGALYAARQAFTKLYNRSGLKRSDQIKKDLEERFELAFPGLQTNILVCSEEVVLYEIRHLDWFIDGVGVNPKYPEIENEYGLTLYTHTYKYKGNGQWTNMRQGNTYYDSLAQAVHTPFEHSAVEAFVKQLIDEGYNMKIGAIFCWPDSDLKLNDEEK